MTIETVYKGTWLSMHTKDSYEFMHRHRKPKAVAIIAIDSNGDLIITKQLRKPHGDTPVYELPAGLVDEGESSIQTAVRELNEETGFAGDFYEVFENIATTPGICTELIDFVMLFNCKKVSKGGGLIEEHEVIEPLTINITHPYDTIINDLSSKGIVSCTLLAGLFYAKYKFN